MFVHISLNTGNEYWGHIGKICSWDPSRQVPQKIFFLNIFSSELCFGHPLLILQIGLFKLKSCLDFSFLSYLIITSLDWWISYSRISWLTRLFVVLGSWSCLVIYCKQNYNLGLYRLVLVKPTLLICNITAAIKWLTFSKDDILSENIFSFNLNLPISGIFIRGDPY